MKSTKTSNRAPTKPQKKKGKREIWKNCQFKLPFNTKALNPYLSSSSSFMAQADKRLMEVKQKLWQDNQSLELKFVDMEAHVQYWKRWKCPVKIQQWFEWWMMRMMCTIRGLWGSEKIAMSSFELLHFGFWILWRLRDCYLEKEVREK